jgi:hypothetical protein
MKKTLLNYFSDIFKSSKNKDQYKQEILSYVDSEYAKYICMPQLEKELICIELARSLGCPSYDAESCSVFLKNYIRSIQ